jgi:GGDEF domain-containing protein
MIFRYGSDEFVVVLAEANRATADAIAARVTATPSTPYILASGPAVGVGVRVASAAAPDDGSSLSPEPFSVRRR